MNNRPKFVFFGTPEFAEIVLKKLVEDGFLPVAVVCNPDRPVGRKKIITPPPTKVLAEKYGIKVLQSGKLEIGEVDFAVVAAYSKIIKKEVLDIPRLGVIGAHPSLLPKYRGSSPIQSAILNGEKETGVTLFLIDEKVDNGPILRSEKLEIRDEGYETLMRKLAELGGNLLVKTLPDFLAGKITPLEQDHSKATFTQKFKTEDAFIKPEDLEKAANAGGETAVKIYNKIRALNPEPGTWTIKNGKRMKILEAELIEGKLKLKKIQMEGKKPFIFS